MTAIMHELVRVVPDWQGEVSYSEQPSIGFVVEPPLTTGERSRLSFLLDKVIQDTEPEGVWVHIADDLRSAYRIEQGGEDADPAIVTCTFPNIRRAHLAAGNVEGYLGMCMNKALAELGQVI